MYKPKEVEYMNFVKRIIMILTLIIISMLIVPLIVINTVKADAGMLLVIILFFCIYPVVSAFVGVIAGKDIKHLWLAPILVAILFWIFSSITYKSAFPFVYSVAYLIISAIGMIITHKIIKK